MHQKHSNISKASFGNFARNEIAVLGTPCSEIKLLFEKIVNHFSQKKISIIEADHKAEEVIGAYSAYTDKINFQRFDTKYKPNSFELRAFFDQSDLVLINGNHFLGLSQIVVIDEKKSLENKLDRLTNVLLIINKTSEIPLYLSDFFGENRPQILNWDNSKGIFQFIEGQFFKRRPLLYGLLLTGGKSTRMGMDKASLKYHNQESQKEYFYKLLQKHCGENVFLSINADQAGTEKLAYISDSFLSIGPMGGILSAFQKHPNVAWLVVACDMPYLSELSLDQLVNGRNSTKLATAFQSQNNEFPEPLITIWEPKAYPKLLQMLSYGIDCPRKTLINSDIELLINKQNKELQNINTKEEYEKAIIDLSPKIV